MDPEDRSDSEAQGSSPRSRELASRLFTFLLVWLLVSAPLVYLIYALVEPGYEAVGLLRVEPMAANLYGSELRGRPEVPEDRPYLQTQVALIKSDRVLDAALARPEIAHLPMVRDSRDPRADLRKAMLVTIVGENTHLIQVALRSRDAAETAPIVNAVVEEYLEQHNRYRQTESRALKKNFEAERDKLEAQIARTRENLARLVEPGRAPVLSAQSKKPAGQEPDEPVDPSLEKIAPQQFRDMTSWLLKVDFELMDAQARLETARRPGSQVAAEKLRGLESDVAEARKRRESYTRYLARVKVDASPPDTEPVDVQLLTQDLQSLRRLHEVIQSKLAQLEFEIGQEVYRITVQDKATVPREPADNGRLTYMAIAPLGVLGLMIGMSLISGIRARRIQGGSRMDAAQDGKGRVRARGASE